MEWMAMVLISVWWVKERERNGRGRIGPRDKRGRKSRGVQEVRT
jgi:hypothetical protein